MTVLNSVLLLCLSVSAVAYHDETQVKNRATSYRSKERVLRSNSPKFGVLQDFSGAESTSSSQLYIRQTANMTISSNATIPNGLTSTDTFIYNDEAWTVYEDLSKADGVMIFVSESGVKKSFGRYLEATTTLANRTVELYLGLNSSEVNLALNDILAEELLKNGEPIEDAVRDVVPIETSINWDSFLGNVQANDTMKLSSDSATRNYYPLDFLLDVFWTNPLYSNWTFDGLIGGWMPAARKIFRRGPDAQDWFESIVFGDVDSTDPDIIHVWFRETWVVNGGIETRFFNLDYPNFPPTRIASAPYEFYSAFLRFADYWDGHLKDFAPLKLPNRSWADMTKHTFALELIQRYAGVYPKYGAFDRDYAGSEYDGFQDIFTSSVTANLLWGRFDQARKVIDNYFTMFVTETGDIQMRGPEIPQFGMSLSLLARYVQYTGDTALLEKYKSKILAWVNILTARHDESLKLARSNSSYGLIAGWSESDSALEFSPEFYTRPYWNNNAFAARGLKDLSKLEMFSDYANGWTSRAEQMINQTVVMMARYVRTDMSPPYVPVLPDMNLTVIESVTLEDPSPQKWAHRVYAELLHAAILPSNLTDTTIDSMQAYGITSLGIVANVWIPYAESRDILGFISYGYALSLLLQDRIDQFVLFLYSHRYHVHNRGQWIPGEVTSTGGDGSYFCMPAGHNLPIIVRAALVFEHPDDDVLMLGRGIPRAWIKTGNETSISGAPTRWGLVDFGVILDQNARTITATVEFAGEIPSETRVKLRVPEGESIKSITANGHEMGMTGEEVVLKLGSFGKNISIIGNF